MGHLAACLMPQHPEPRPRDDTDAAKDIARDLAEIASHIGQLKGEANAYLSDLRYNTLRLRLEAAHSAVEAAAVEARRRVRLNEGRNPRMLPLCEGLDRLRRGQVYLPSSVE
jgi:hypothetical protein